MFLLKKIFNIVREKIIPNLIETCANITRRNTERNLECNPDLQILEEKIAAKIKVEIQIVYDDNNGLIGIVKNQQDFFEILRIDVNTFYDPQRKTSVYIVSLESKDIRPFIFEIAKPHSFGNALDYHDGSNRMTNYFSPIKPVFMYLELHNIKANLIEFMQQQAIALLHTGVSCASNTIKAYTDHTIDKIISGVVESALIIFLPQCNITCIRKASVFLCSNIIKKKLKTYISAKEKSLLELSQEKLMLDSVSKYDNLDSKGVFKSISKSILPKDAVVSVDNNSGSTNYPYYPEPPYNNTSNSNAMEERSDNINDVIGDD